jgi:hypothetical protein
MLRDILIYETVKKILSRDWWGSENVKTPMLRDREDSETLKPQQAEVDWFLKL